jgi:putative ABC transport system ATP-binding protein
MLKVEHLSKVYPNGTVALKDVSFEVADGEFLAVIGLSGSGKSTLLRCINRIIEPSAGKIIWNGIDVTAATGGDIRKIRRQMGFIFQQFNLIKGITALENVMLPAYPNGENYVSLKKRAMDLLDLLNIGGKATSKVEWLSGGEAQRTAIARALINNPAIIIADEPTAHLDTRLSAEFMEIMRQLKQEGKTILIASHDPIVYESDVIDRIVEMRDGKIVSSGDVP